MIPSVVTVTVDRPAGTYHPEHPNLYYPINYGYIEGTEAPDGEETDAYILSITEPTTKFTGRVIAIIHHLNDVEDKLVVAPEGLTFTKEQIFGFTSFIEQYFEIEIEILS